MRLFARVLVLFLIAPLAQTLHAADVVVVGLFADKAVLKIDGEQKLLRAGEHYKNVKLIAADSEKATLEINGKRDHYKIGSDISTSFAPVINRKTQIARNAQGHYFTTASLNGLAVSALIDTGATTVALNQPLADRLNLPYRLRGTPTMVSTASGFSKAWIVRLNSVKLGEIERRDVEATVIEGSAPSDVLIGMSFLRTLSMRDENNVLYLEAKY